MYNFLLIVHVMCCIFLVTVVLLQVGRGRGMLGFLGSSTAETLFGGRAGDVLTKTTTVIAALFMMTSLSLAYISLKKSGSIVKGVRTKHGDVSKTMTIPAEGAVQSEDKLVQKGSELVEKAKAKLKGKLPNFGTEKKEAATPIETTKSKIRYDENNNKIVEEYKYDSTGKLTGHKEVTYDRLDKVLGEKELPLVEEKVTVETPQ